MGYVRYRGSKEMHTEFSWGNLKERDLLEDLGTDGRNIKTDLQETVQEGVERDSSGSRWGHTVDICEHNNEPLGSTKCRKFLN
jgi:hypothetical protein